MKTKGWRPFLLIAALMMMVPIGAASAQGTVTFGTTTTEIDFPNSLTWRVNVSNTDEEIVSADLIYSFRVYNSSPSKSRFEVEMTPGTSVDLVYEWDTSEMTVVPNTPINYYWEVTDAAGNVTKSEELFIEYEDNMYDWQKLETDQVRVWWHDKPSGFGKNVMDIANRAIKEQRALFGAELETPVMIIVYNSSAEFNEWQAVPLDWVGGQAFSDFGITAQIVTSRSASSDWLNDVVPHEISHLYFAQVTNNPTVSIPHWLNEGVAQYNEFNSPDWAIFRAESAAKNDELLPLTVLAGGFGSYNEDRIYLSYAEAVSAIIYMVETYGEEGMARLLAAYKDGLVTEDAFPAALGVSMGQFQIGWAVWLGAPAESMITPTPWPSPTFPASPTPFGWEGDGSTAVPEATEAAVVEPTEAVDETEDDAPVPTEVEEDEGIFTRCLGGILPILTLGFGLIFEGRRRKGRE